MRDPADLDARSRAALEMALAVAGFVFEITRVLEIEQQNPDALFERGMLHALAGDIDSARGDWQQVMTVAPGSSAAEAAKANLEATAVQ